MSYATKCDRCGAYHDGRQYQVEVSPPGFNAEDKEYDLCRDCGKELEDFIKGLRPFDFGVKRGFKFKRKKE